MDNIPMIWCATEAKTRDNLCTKSRCNISRLWIWITVILFLITIKLICIYVSSFLPAFSSCCCYFIALNLFLSKKMTVCLSTCHSSLGSKYCSCISVACVLVMGRGISAACVLVMGYRISAACVLMSWAAEFLRHVFLSWAGEFLWHVFLSWAAEFLWHVFLSRATEFLQHVFLPYFM